MYYFVILLLTGVVFGVELAAQFNCQVEKAPPTVMKCIQAVEQRGIRVYCVHVLL